VAVLPSGRVTVMAQPFTRVTFRLPPHWPELPGGVNQGTTLLAKKPTAPGLATRGWRAVAVPAATDAA
jgi:hypothetical protein